MRQRRNREINVFGVSFLDVLANTIGGLAFLLVLGAMAIGASVGYVRPVVNTESLPRAYHGQAYTSWLSAREGLGKFEWSFGEGDRPQGLVLDSATGRLSGVLQLDPEDPSSRQFEFGVRVRSTAAANDTVPATVRRFALTVDREAPVFTPPLHIVTDSTLPSAYRETPYPLAFAAEGGQPPYTWSSSALPPGLTLLRSGVLDGRPVQVGEYVFDVSVQTDRGERQVKRVSLAVSERHPPPPPVPPLRVVTTEVPDAVAERPYPLTLSAEGGTPPYLWSVESGGPAWLETGSDGAGTGTPGLGDVGDTVVTWRVLDTAGRTAVGEAVPLTVLPPVEDEPPPLQLKTTELNDGRVGRDYHLAIAVEGGFPPYVWTWENGGSGLDLGSESGLLTGTPGEAGEYDASWEVTDRAGNRARRSGTLHIHPEIFPIRILTERGPTGRVAEPYHLALSATGGVPPHRWFTVSQPLPPGLSLDTVTGVVSDTPTTDGSWRTDFAVTDALAGDSAEPIALTLDILTARGTRRLVIVTSSIPRLLVNDSADVAMAVVGGTEPYGWAADTLPPGLVLNGGHLVGTPRRAGRTAVTFRVTDTVGDTASVRLTVETLRATSWWLFLMVAVALVIATLVLLWLWRRYRARDPRALHVLTESIPNARASCDYAVQLACEGGVPPYSWRVVDGELPPGMELSADGCLAGRPYEGVGVDATREIPFTVEVTDQAGESVRQRL